MGRACDSSLFLFQGDPGESGAPGIQGEPGVKVSGSKDAPPRPNPSPSPRLPPPADDPILHCRDPEESEGRREKPELPVLPGHLAGKGLPATTDPRATP